MYKKLVKINQSWSVVLVLLVVVLVVVVVLVLVPANKANKIS